MSRYLPPLGALHKPLIDILVLDVVLGLVLIIDRQPISVQPGYRVAENLLPIPAWGGMLIAITVFAVATRANPAVFVVAFVPYFVLGAANFVSAYQNPSKASFVGAVVFGYIGHRHYRLSETIPLMRDSTMQAGLSELLAKVDAARQSA